MYTMYACFMCVCVLHPRDRALVKGLGPCKKAPANECFPDLKEAEGRAETVRSNQRSSNALYCRVNERMNNVMRRDSCSSSLINFVLSKLFLMNCRMSSS